MGIDVHMSWKNKTDDESAAQITGFSITSGNVGYLREAYHGGPYVTHYLVSEAFGDDSEEGPKIPAATLRQRLPNAIVLALIREAVVYGGDNPAIIEMKGDNDLGKSLRNCFSEIKRIGETEGCTELVALEDVPQGVFEAIKLSIASHTLPDYALAYVEFVELAEQKESETGEPVSVYASY